MPKSLHSAGGPGVSRCSEGQQAATATPAGLVDRAPFPGLPFVIHRCTQRGRVVSREFFNVPAMPFDEGYAYGLEVAGQVLAWAQAHVDPWPSASGTLSAMLEAACKVLSQTNSASVAPSKRGAAMAFVCVLMEVAAAGARHLDWQSHLTQKQAQATAWRCGARPHGGRQRRQALSSEPQPESVQ